MRFIGNQGAIVFTAILAALLLVWSSANWRGQAQNIQLPQPSGYVNDFAEVVEPATKQRLETVLANLKERTGIVFFVATVKSAGGQYLSDYSLRIANDWKVAPNTQPKGFLLLLTPILPNFFPHPTH